MSFVFLDSPAGTAPTARLSVHERLAEFQRVVGEIFWSEKHRGGGHGRQPGQGEPGDDSQRSLGSFDSERWHNFVKK
jgi:hypothetical protein